MRAQSDLHAMMPVHVIVELAGVVEGTVTMRAHVRQSIWQMRCVELTVDVSMLLTKAFGPILSSMLS